MNHRPAVLIAIAVLIAAALGFVRLNAGGDGPKTGSQVTVFTEDLQHNPLSGVEIQVLDESGKSINSGATDGNGEIIVNLGSTSATYRVVAPKPPDGYVNHSDSDAGLVNLNGITCDTPTACLFYFVNAAGSVTAGGDVNLDSGKGTITLMSAGSLVDDEETALDPGPVDDLEDDVLADDGECVGATCDADVICGDEDCDDDHSCDDDSCNDDADSDLPENLDGYLLVGADASFDGAYLPRTQLVCPDTVHTPPVVDPSFPSHVRLGIWVNGQPGILSLSGDGINGGSPVDLDDFSGGPAFFDLPIDSYGDKTVTEFTHTAENGTTTDLLPTFFDAWDGPFPVTGAEGPLDDNPLCDTLREDPFSLEGTQLPGFDPAEDNAGPGPSYPDALEAATAFVELFGAAHENGDTEFLLGTLHPAAGETYGQDACDSTVFNTVGSISNVQLLWLGESTSYDYEVPDGPIPLPNAWPMQLSVDIAGEMQAIDGHLFYDGGDVNWLTHCTQ